MLSLVLVLLAAAPAKTPFTAADLVRLERVSDPHVSPNGHTVAYSVRETDWEANKGRTSIWLVDLKDKQPRRITSTGNESPRWSPDGNTLYFLSSRSGSSQVWSISMLGGEAVQVTSLPIDVSAFAVAPAGERLVVALDVFPDCPKVACTKERLDARVAGKATGQLYDQLFVRHWDTWKNGTRGHLFAVNLAKPADEPVKLTRDIDGDAPTKPFGDASELAFSPDGKTLYFVARIAGRTEPWSTNTDVFSVPVDGSAKPTNLTVSNLATDTAPAISPDGKSIAYLGMRRPGFEADKLTIYTSPLAGGKITPHELAGGWDRSATAIAWSANGKAIYALADDVGQRRVFALDAASGAQTPVTDKGSVAAFDVTADGIVVAMDDLRTPTQLYRVPVGATRDQLTKHGLDALDGKLLGDFEQFSFIGWNGEIVYGYVVKPAQFDPKQKYPLAFLIHGGPQGSFGNHWHYRWNPQTYAGAGFVAVMIDFHGSTGYGQGFTDSISGDWGGKPLEDLQKGLAHVLKTYAFVDSSRACALGASYGGYMINWIEGTWPEPWKCLVNHDGVFDARGMAYATDELWFDEWEHGGKPYEKPEAYEKHTPVAHVGKWKTPMLVVHGGNDHRVTLDQGLSTFTALQSREVPSQLLYFPDENHWVLKPRNSLQWHETVEAWLKRWTGATKTPAAKK